MEDRLAPAAWTPLGPAPVVGNVNDGGSVTGRVNSIAPDPSDPTGTTVIIGTAGGGVWRGTNVVGSSFTTNWTPLTDNLADQINDPLVTLDVGAVATVLDPTTGKTVIYAGLGESNAASYLMTPSEGASQFYGAGMIKSVDDGQTWSLLGGPGASNIFYRSAFSKIIIDPANPNVIYAAVTTAKNGVTGHEGVWKSADGGQTWTNTTAAAGLPTTLAYSDLVMNPGNPNVLYAAVGEAAGNNANGVYVTFNGGQNWQLMTNLPYGSQGGTAIVGRITLAISQTTIATTNPNYALYAAFMATNTTPGEPPANPNTLAGNLYELGYVQVNGTPADTSSAWNVLWGDAGSGATRFHLPPSTPINYVGFQGFYGTSLIVDPTNASHVYAGGQDNFLDISLDITTGKGNSAFNPATVRDIAFGHGPASTPGNPNTSNGIHVDHHGIAVLYPAGNPAQYSLLDGDDGGVFQFVPTANTWFNLNSNLQLTQVYGVAANPSNPGQIFEGAQDNGNARTLGGPVWQATANDGDGSLVFIDSTTSPATVYVTQTADVWKSVGDPFQPTTPPALQTAFQKLPNQPGRGKFPGNFPAPAYTMQVVNGQDYLWYGGTDSTGNNAGVWLSTNGGGSWVSITTAGLNGWPVTTTTTENGQVIDNTVVDSIGVSATNPNLVYVGLRGGHLLVTTNGLSAAPIWTELDPVPVTSSSQVDLRYNSILVNPNDPNNAYVVAASFGDITGGGHVWMTRDAGRTWMKITGNLPDVPAWSIQGQFTGAGPAAVLYVGTDVGVFVSTDVGASWSKYGTGLPNVQVRAMQLLLNPQNPSLNVLLIGTLGRGVYQITPLSVPSFAVGAGAGAGPQLNLYDPTTGALTASLLPWPATFTGGVRVAHGAVAGDGVPDIVVGAGPGGGPEVKVYDGATFQLIRDFYAWPTSFTGGVFVAAGEFNGDRFTDIVVGADAGAQPEVKIFSGKDLSLLADFYAFPTFFRGGVRVAVADVNGDGTPDIVCGAGPGGGPQVTVFDGKTFQPILSFYAFPLSYTAGVYVAAGDTTGTGRADIIVGAGAGPQVAIFKGTDGNLVSTFFAFPTSFTGGVRVGFQPYYGSTGRAAILAGAGPGGGPEVIAFDSLTLQTLGAFFALPSSFTGGVYVSE